MFFELGGPENAYIFTILPIRIPNSIPKRCAFSRSQSPIQVFSSVRLVTLVSGIFSDFDSKKLRFLDQSSVFQISDPRNSNSLDLREAGHGFSFVTFPFQTCKPTKQLARWEASVRPLGDGYFLRIQTQWDAFPTHFQPIPPLLLRFTRPPTISEILGRHPHYFWDS